MDNSIKQLREQMGLSQADLGSSVDVSRQTINSIIKWSTISIMNMTLLNT